MHIRKHNIQAIGRLKELGKHELILNPDSPHAMEIAELLDGLFDAFYDPAPIYPLGDDIGMVKLIQYAGDDKMVVNAARISFDGDNEEPLNARDVKLINYLLSHHHGSPTEHNLITYKVVDPITTDRQWVRHRIAVAKNEVSGRYTEVPELIYTPLEFRAQAVSNRQASVEDTGTIDQDHAHEVWEEAWRAAYKAYKALLEAGVAREQARGILPQSMYTENYYSFNLRSLMHFIALRDHEGAQWEIQQYARALYQLALPIFPETLGIFEKLRSHEAPPKAS